MLKAFVVLITLMAGALILVGQNTATAQPQSETPSAAMRGGFRGQILLVVTEGMKTPQFILEQPELRTVGDSGFVVGRQVVLNTGSWVEGRIVWIPAQRIVSMIEMETLDEYKRLAADAAGKAE